VDIQSLEFTPKGWDYARSRQRRVGNADMWNVIREMFRLGGKARTDQIVMYVFGGDERRASKAIGECKSNGLIEKY
jgi:hypothetical protein